MLSVNNPCFLKEYAEIYYLVFSLLANIFSETQISIWIEI